MAHMREDRRAVRNRVYMLVTAGMMLLLCVVALAGFLHVGRKELDAKHYSEPWRVLKELVRVQDKFRLRDVDKDGELDYAASLEELERANMITRAMAEEVVRGYRYRLQGHGQTWEASATPASVTSLHYFADQTGVIRAARGQPAGPDSQVYWHPLYERVWPSGNE